MSPFLRDLGWVILFPLSCLWAVVTLLRRRLLKTGKRFQPLRKTLIVGNLHSGGSGKTPIVAAIAQHFAALSPVIISRGYLSVHSERGAAVERRTAQGPVVFGDEPWMLKNRLQCPVYVGRDRAAILARAEKESTGKVFVLDDAFQNFSFRHDIDLVAVQTDRPLDDAYCLPFGQLREPLVALRSASAVVLVHGASQESSQQWRLFLQDRFPELPCFDASVRVDGIWGVDGPVKIGGNLPWGAFCGIAHPKGFERSLKQVVHPSFLEMFPDHHAYEPHDIERLFALKAKHDTHHFVTTEKDWHKALPHFEKRSAALFYLRIEYVFSEEFWYFLKTRLETA